jgi:hypothetical protein
VSYKAPSIWEKSPEVELSEKHFKLSPLFLGITLTIIAIVLAAYAIANSYQHMVPLQ